MSQRTTSRVDRIAERLKHGVGEILVSGDLRDPRLTGAVVTRAWVSADLRLGRVYFGTYDGVADARRRAELIHGFRSAAGFLRGRLDRSLGLRRSPELQFFWDDELDRVREVDGVLEELAVGRPDDAVAPKEPS